MATPTTSSSFSLIYVPPTAPAGGITITQPQQTATSFFKIASGESITFAWNMTSVIVMPTSLTLQALDPFGNTYAVGPNNGVIPATQTEVVWDLYSYQINNPTRPLAPTTYTLNIMDERGTDAPRKAGYLQPNTGLQFALYSPQAYTALADGWHCATCSSASTYVSHPAFISLFITFFIVFFSGFHLLRSSSRST